MIPNIAQSPRGSRRPHTDGKVAAVRRLVETTLFAYGEISARTGVGRASICRWTRDGAWARPLFAPRATDTVPRWRASAKLRRRTLASRLSALAERYVRELEASPGVDLEVSSPGLDRKPCGAAQAADSHGRGHGLRDGARDRHTLRHSGCESRWQPVWLQERHDIPARSRRRRSGSRERGHRRLPHRSVAAAAPRGAVRRQTRGSRAGPGHARTARIANIAKNRERLVVPPDDAEAGKLAANYVSPTLGTLRVRMQEGATIFDFGKWRSAVASRRNDDGTTSFISIDPTISGFNFVVGERDGKRALIVRDAQHEYAFIEAVPP